MTPPKTLDSSWSTVSPNALVTPTPDIRTLLLADNAVIRACVLFSKLLSLADTFSKKSVLLAKFVALPVSFSWKGGCTSKTTFHLAGAGAARGRRCCCCRASAAADARRRAPGRTPVAARRLRPNREPRPLGTHGSPTLWTHATLIRLRGIVSSWARLLTSFSNPLVRWRSLGGSPFGLSAVAATVSGSKNSAKSISMAIVT